MAGDNNVMQEKKETAEVQVRLKPQGTHGGPLLANLTNVSVAQGIAHVDFGFIEPAMLGAIAGRTQQGKPLPNGIEGLLTTRVALPLEALVRLQQQLSQVLVQLKAKRQANS